MNRTTTLVLAAVSALMTPFALSAAGLNKPDTPVSQASQPVAMPSVPTPTVVPECARPVRVVYPAYQVGTTPCAAAYNRG
jgi:hypothetical protein